MESRCGRQLDDGVPQKSSAGNWLRPLRRAVTGMTIEETGHVRLVEADRQASANSAKMQRSTGLVTLDGSPMISDSQSRTTAGSVSINQQSGEIHATGGVVSTYLAAASGSSAAVNLGTGPAHISADRLDGSSSAGHVTYSGHARLWQGESVLEAEQIEIWRDEKRMEARGHIVAIFQQEPGTGPAFGMVANKTSAAGPPTGKSGAAEASKATLWQIRSTSLTYLSDQGQAHLEGGVVASSDQGSLESRSLDVFLAPRRRQWAASNKKPWPSEGAGGREVRPATSPGRRGCSPRGASSHGRAGGIHRGGPKIRSLRRPTDDH